MSAVHGDRVSALIEAVLEEFEGDADVHEQEQPDDEELRIAVIGRPNVGKSTLINRLIGEDRLVVFDQPGTTRDSVAVPFVRNDRNYVLIDTAGIRRRARVQEAIEKFSIVKALQAIEQAQVVIAVLDAHEGITEQDVSLLGLVLERGRALVVVTNKWDGLSAEQRKHVREQLDRRLPFLEFAERDRTDARTRECGHRAPAAHGSRAQDPAALRAPGRPQPAGNRDPRQPDGARARGVQALPDQSFPQSV